VGGNQMNLDFKLFYMDVINYFQQNIYIAIALAGVFLLLLLRKPKLFFTIVLIASINISLLYVISYTSSLGEAQKFNLIQKNTLHVRAS
jgi:hypothetical protein